MMDPHLWWYVTMVTTTRRYMVNPFHPPPPRLTPLRGTTIRSTPLSSTTTTLLAIVHHHDNLQLSLVNQLHVLCQATVEWTIAWSPPPTPQSTLLPHLLLPWNRPHPHHHHHHHHRQRFLGAMYRPPHHHRRRNHHLLGLQVDRVREIAVGWYFSSSSSPSSPSSSSSSSSDGVEMEVINSYWENQTNSYAMNSCIVLDIRYASDTSDRLLDRLIHSVPLFFTYSNKQQLVIKIIRFHRLSELIKKCFLVLFLFSY